MLATALVLSLLPLQDVAAKCDELLQGYMRAGWTGAALVARDGKTLLARGYGRADPSTGRLNTEATLFDIASISKSFTAAAILKLEQQGKLSTDDSIEKHLPGVPAHSRRITVLQLLSHTSGVPRGNVAGHGEDLEAAVREYLATGPENAPGKRFEYWNGGYALLAGIVEGASGKRFETYLEEELFAPAGMLDTGFTGATDLDAARVAFGRSTDAEPRSALAHPLGSFGYEYRGMGGVVTTALDLMRWDRALAGTDVLGEEAKRKLFTPVKDGYACGWYVRDGAYGGTRQSHGGVVRGFDSELRRYPNAQACIAVLSNSVDAKSETIADNLEAVLFGLPLRTPPPESVALSDEELALYAGCYATKGGRIRVRPADGALEAGIEGLALLDEFARGERDRTDRLAPYCAKAVAWIEALARGDTDAVKREVRDADLDVWLEYLVKQTWPERVATYGALERVTALGAVRNHEVVDVLVALEHERETCRARLSFGSKGIGGLEWKGPEFLAVLRLVPMGNEQFDERSAATPRRFTFTRKDGRVTALASGDTKLKREE